MNEARFAARIQSLRRIAIPKKTFNKMNLEKGGTIDVTIRVEGKKFRE